MSAILFADELREQIILKSGIKLCKTPLGHQWPDLDFGWDGVELGKIDKSFPDSETDTMPGTDLDQASSTDTVILNHSQEAVTDGNSVSQNTPATQFTRRDDRTVDSSIPLKETTKARREDLVEDTILTRYEADSSLLDIL